jgi:glycosyltransferase involved in cell wall biosynthesis
LKLSVLIPAYNERETIEELVRRVAAVDLGPGSELEIIVVDDGSTDGTRQILAGLKVSGLRVIEHERNQGKGGAIRTALAAATGDAVIFQDADLEYDPQDFPKLWALIARGEAQAVYGARDLGDQAFFRRFGNHFLTWATNVLYGTHLKDMETCYKMIAIPIARTLDLQSHRFDMEPEITAKIIRAGHTIHEVPISYEPRIVRKLSPWRDGWPALRTLIKYRFSR